jgi:hypothetical protein
VGRTEWLRSRRRSSSGDVVDPGGVARSFAEDCTFMMPILREPLRGRAALEQHATMWPTSMTNTEWVAIDGDRLVLAWSWRGQGDGWADLPLLRGVSIFVFNEDGLVQTCEDFFDPDWMTRTTSQTDV